MVFFKPAVDFQLNSWNYRKIWTPTCCWKVPWRSVEQGNHQAIFVWCDCKRLMWCDLELHLEYIKHPNTGRYMPNKKRTNSPGSKPKWIIAALAIYTQWGSIWSCCLYPRQGSRRRVKSTRNQRSTFGRLFANFLFTKQRLKRSSLEKLTLHSLMIVVITLYKCRSPSRHHLLRLP